MADQSLIVIHELTEDFDLENELFEVQDDLMMLSAVSCFMRRDLNRIQDYFEVTVPTYTSSEFRSHFPPVKQELAFVWSTYQPWWLTKTYVFHIGKAEKATPSFKTKANCAERPGIGARTLMVRNFLTFRSEWKKRSISEGTLQFRTEFPENYLTI